MRRRPCCITLAGILAVMPLRADGIVVRAGTSNLVLSRPRHARYAVTHMWAGESRANKLFDAANIPDNVSPVAFGAGVALLIASNLGVVAVLIAERLAPGSMPPLNAFTDIANVAMERAVRAGEVPAPFATFWAQLLWLELIREYIGAGLPAQHFISDWCNAQDHFDICVAAKEASAQLVQQEPPAAAS